MKNIKRLKAFTLNEVVIVIAIIGIFGAMSTMAMGRWVGETRMDAANSDAKILFNSAQSVIQDFKTQERDKLNFADGGLTGPLTGSRSLVDNFFMYYDGATKRLTFTHFVYAPASAVPIPEIIGVTNNYPLTRNMVKSDAQLVWEIHTAIVKYYSDANDYSWAIYVKNSIVRSVAISEDPNWRYVGSYPQNFSLDDVNDMRVPIGAFEYHNGFQFNNGLDVDVLGFMDSLADDYVNDVVTVKGKPKSGYTPGTPLPGVVRP